MSAISEIADVAELCSRLHRETSARAVMVLGGEGDILGHAGTPSSLAEAVLDGVADVTAEALQRAAAGTSPGGDGDDPLQQVGSTQICGASLDARPFVKAQGRPRSPARLPRCRVGDGRRSWAARRSSVGRRRSADEPVTPER